MTTETSLGRGPGPGWDRLMTSIVTPGVWATTMPFPSRLAYSFSYLVETQAGVILIDLGWDSDAAWDALQTGLRRSGHSMADVIGVVATHAHPDHYGLAARVKSHSDAWIAMHPAEAELVATTDDERILRTDELARWLVECGVPADQLEEFADELQAIQRNLASVAPDITLTDRDRIPGTDGAILAIHTPGHTPGHLCFHDRERNLVFTGDHVLPRVTPNVSLRPRTGTDPLRDFAGSLDKLLFYPDAMVLPGHEWQFDKISDRVAALHDHHRERLDEIASAVRSGAATVWDVAQAIRWSRPFSTLDSRARRQAIGETHAHLERLVAADRLTKSGSDPVLWSIYSI